MKWRFLSIFFLWACLSQSYAQRQAVPLNREFGFPLEAKIFRSDTIFHTAAKPLLQSKLQALKGVENSNIPTLNNTKQEERSNFALKAFFEHLFIVDEENFELTLDPLFNLELGDDQDAVSDDRLYKNTRGFLLRMNIGDKVSVNTSFLENQAQFPAFIHNQVVASEVTRGQGRVKIIEDGVDFSMSSSVLSYSPSERLNIQIGHDKHFFGDGYRSLLLSDNAFNYPFLRVNSSWFDGKVQYTNLLATFQLLNRIPLTDREGLFERKQGSFTYLDWAVSKNFYLGFFEGIIWPSLDSSGNRPFPLNYFSPVLFSNSLIYGLEDDTYNAMIGLNWRWKLAVPVQLYGQFAFDNASIADAGWQIGASFYGVKNLLLQAEWNHAQERTFNDLSTFDHYVQSISVPYAGDWNEWIGIANYRYKRWSTLLKLHRFEQEQLNYNLLDASQAYVINPATNFSMRLGAIVRRSEMDGFQPTTFVYFGLSTNLQNLYFDY